MLVAWFEAINLKGERGGCDWSFTRLPVRGSRPSVALLSLRGITRWPTVPKATHSPFFPTFVPLDHRVAGCAGGGIYGTDRQADRPISRQMDRIRLVMGKCPTIMAQTMERVKNRWRQINKSTRTHRPSLWLKNVTHRDSNLALSSVKSEYSRIQWLQTTIHHPYN